MSEQNVEIEGFKLKILRAISEGGFGIVYLVENESKQGPKMALKKIITQDEERFKIAWKELNFLKAYCGQPNNVFINYLGSKIIEENPSKYCFYILIEYCNNGTLFDLMAIYMQKKQKFSEEEIVVLLRAANSCLVALHSLGIIHCDFKIENLLFFNWECVKLCDFGSINNFSIDFSQVPRQQFYDYETLFEKQTTLMYRPPEMCDLYLGYKVNNKVDMWMLGCVLFTLMFFKHPFHESTKLSIVNASYFWPDDSPYSAKLENLTRNLLTPNPDFRPNASEVKNMLDNWEQINAIDLNKMAFAIKQESLRMRNIVPLSVQVKAQTKGEYEHQAGLKKNDNFDFSGLDRLCKKPSEQKVSISTNKRNVDKLNSFNFMNLDFGEATGQETHQNQLKPNDMLNFEQGKIETLTFDPFDALQQTKDQNSQPKIPNSLDPFNINFSANK